MAPLSYVLAVRTCCLHLLYFLGSASMLSETIHSVGDSLNQALLAVGLKVLKTSLVTSCVRIREREQRIQLIFSFYYRKAGESLIWGTYAFHSKSSSLVAWMCYCDSQSDQQDITLPHYLSRHPYGYGREQFIWSLISAVGVFFLGCGVTVYHGVSTLITPPDLTNLPIALSVLGASFVLEGVTLGMAIRLVHS